MNVKRTVEFIVNMNAKSMVSASQRGDWSTVENLVRITESMIVAYEKQIKAVRL